MNDDCIRGSDGAVFEFYARGSLFATVNDKCN